MTEYIIGFVVGLLVGFVIMTIDCHRHKVKLRVKQEQRYVKLQGHVGQAVEEIEKIINGSKT
jgi:uncharacterized membrane-anchored protein YhcB (DUF1043 family)